MTNIGPSVNLWWAPPSCTLPAAEQPLRQHQFDQLFTDALSIDRVGPTRTRLTLRPEPQHAMRTAELSSRETGCCSFFTFTLTFAESALTLDVAVPPARVAVLDALTEHARLIMAGGAE